MVTAPQQLRDLQWRMAFGMQGLHRQDFLGSLHRVRTLHRWRDAVDGIGWVKRRHTETP